MRRYAVLVGFALLAACYSPRDEAVTDGQKLRASAETPLGWIYVYRDSAATCYVYESNGYRGGISCVRR